MQNVLNKLLYICDRQRVGLLSEAFSFYVHLGLPTLFQACVSVEMIQCLTSHSRSGAADPGVGEGSTVVAGGRGVAWRWGERSQEESALSPHLK